MADEIGQQSDAAAVGPGLETSRWPEWVILNSVRGTWVVKPGIFHADARLRRCCVAQPPHIWMYRQAMQRAAKESVLLMILVK